MSLTASYLYTVGNRLPVYRNINLVQSGQFLADGRPVFSTTARVYPGFANIISAESVGHSTYNGANLTLRRRLARGYEMIATYTWSHAIDDAPEQNNIDSGANFLSDPSNRRRDKGNSLTDKRHVFNMTGVLMPEFKAGNKTANYLLNNNRLSVALVASSGDLFNIANNFHLRHKDLKQVDDYGDEYLDWLYWWYLATVDLLDQLIGKQASANP